MQIGNIVDDTKIGFKNPQRGRVYSVEGLSPCLNCCEGGGLEPKIMEAKIIKKGNYSPSNHNASSIVNRESVKNQEYRIRKLTPKECFRLMGVGEREIDMLLKSGISNAQLYKMAGNSIVVDVLYHIFRKLFIEKENENLQQTLF